MADGSWEEPDNQNKVVNYFEKMAMHPELISASISTPNKRLTDYFFIPQLPAEEQHIIRFGFRMRDNDYRPDAPDLPVFNPMSALDILEELIARGHEHVAGVMAQHFSEEGHMPDPERYQFWAAKAIAAGDLHAALDLGESLELGEFLKQDLPRAALLYRSAAEAGISRAQTRLGLLLYEGLGLSQNIPAAIDWITRAAEQGDPIAYLSLGTIHMEGDAFQPDDAEAYKWLKLAEQNMSEAPKKLSLTQELLEQLVKRMHPDQILAGEIRISMWSTISQ
jgi:hypothetical protein